jgi:hypothetical protein
MLAFVLTADEGRLGTALLLAPGSVAVATVLVRRDRWASKALLLAGGCALTVLLLAFTYHPTVGNRLVRPESVNDIVTGGRYVNAFGDLTLDLSSLPSSTSGDIRIAATTAFGDVIVKLPEQARVQLSGSRSIAVDHQTIEGPPFSRSSATLIVRLTVDGAFGTVTVVH